MTTNAKQLKFARVVGFFSMPSPSLAEQNPTAYSNAIAALPHHLNPGTCSQCGMGIVHHVVIVDGAGKTRCVGHDCAEKVGCDPEQLRNNLTDEQREARAAKREAFRKEIAEASEKLEAQRLARRAKFADIIAVLEAEGSEFHSSLALQLSEGSLSDRQAEYVCKSVVRAAFGSPRLSKRSEPLWEATYSRVTAK